MSTWIKYLLSGCLGLSSLAFATQTEYQASLQRGAQIYFNYCSSCHSLSYERYSRVAKNIGVTNNQGQVYTDIVQNSMLFNPQADIHQTIVSSMPADNAKQWFGVVPPDLTNIVLIHSPEWLYNFLRGFYNDSSRPFGSNNIIAPNTLMPNVLLPLRGETIALWNQNHFDHFVTIHPGSMKPLEFDHAMQDLVNFLSMVADPYHTFRIWLGIITIVFLLILFLMLYFWLKTYKDTD